MAQATYKVLSLTPAVTIYYICQVNRVKLADILFSLLSVCQSVCLCALSPVFNSVCPSHNASGTSLMQPISLVDICTL